jgi:hypothetical protein
VSSVQGQVSYFSTPFVNNFKVKVFKIFACPHPKKENEKTEDRGQRRPMMA